MRLPLKERSSIITGGSQGLGLAIAEAFVQAGANVLVCARDEATLQQASKKLRQLSGPEQIVAVQKADVSQVSDVEQLVATAVRLFPQIHILVNNAGVYGPKGTIEEQDWHEWMKAIEINLFGSVLLCRALLPHFKTHRYGKIVQLSGGGATQPMPRVSAYAASKAAVVRFIETLAQEAREYNIDANALAPGAMNTRMLDEILAVGPEKLGQSFYQRLMKQKTEGGSSIETAAQLAVFLASSASDSITGKLISAVWDNWAELPEHIEDLNQTDVYTLRRILPKERGFTWGE